MKGRVLAPVSIMHFFVDFVCGCTIFHYASSGQLQSSAFLLYNFCAFAMQMPLGILLDLLCQRKKDVMMPSYFMTIAGLILTMFGAFGSVVVSGLGNALFHVGGGVIAIEEDDRYGLASRGLGIFVSPGAVGLALGILCGRTEFFTVPVLIALCAFVLLGVLLKKQMTEEAVPVQDLVFDRTTLLSILSCFLVVVLRGWGGMALQFPWKTNTAAVLACAVCAALGKTAGGFLAARFGAKRTLCVSLVFAALCFTVPSSAVLGLLGLVLFNISMPITLYALKQQMPAVPGLAFGILTFGLFIGYLPGYFGLTSGVSNLIAGSLASLISIAIMCMGVREWKNY